MVSHPALCIHQVQPKVCIQKIITIEVLIQIFLGRSLPVSNTISSTSSLSSISVTPSNNSLNNIQDDDAASDISDVSDRKHDTEGEETDTAPEAEAVNNDNFDGGYGDYVTRCIW